MRAYHFLFILLILGSLQRCATVKSPTGGPKDTLPPIPIAFSPLQNSRNFTGKIVSIRFDELVKIKDQKEVIITPRPGKEISIQAKNYTITIEPKNGWKDSTTYSINFREAVQDITESNPAKNLRLAFSTGPIIDSLSISGSVALAEKETTPEKITVAIYQADTFNIFKHQPSYFTETTKLGTFKIENLKPGIYRIYAFEDKNKNLKIDSQNELYAFLGDSINLTANTDKKILSLTKIDSRKLKVTNLRHNVKYSKIKFNKGTVSYNLVPVTGIKPTNNYGDTQAEIDVYHNETLIDSAAMKITAIDSLGDKLDTTVYIKATTAKTLKEKFLVSVKSSVFEYEHNTFKIQLGYNIPLKAIQQDTVVVTVDSTFNIRIHPEDIEVDTMRKTLSLTCALNKKITETALPPLPVYISKGVFISIENDSSKALKTNILFLKEEETAKLQVSVSTASPHYILQILTGDYKLVQQVIDQKQFLFKNLAPAEYKIRVIVDANGNGKWDQGNFYKHIEPEKIIYLRNNVSGKHEFPLRANWEAGPYTIRF